ncbi:MAG TPA: beta-N-acetylglucosaminidase domain-containing protein [Verrucomicrobiae bacterium]|nr:beta-N-acetylglucosaminidase domain-containing protein [Verrucomicrobiae bacterium]
MMTRNAYLLILLSLTAILPLRAEEQIPAALAHFTGADFQGGAKDLFGSDFDGNQVNEIYAMPTGAHATMEVTFPLQRVPPGPLFVHLKARDDDHSTRCMIAIELNGRVLFEGNNTFPSKTFETRRFPVPAGVLNAGTNTLRIACREKKGKLGMPPWFQVATCVVGPAKYVIRRDLHKDFWVTLPAEKRPFPEPLPEGGHPGFKFRGTKGWLWSPEQYMAEIPWLVKFKMNFLMNCYGSMCDIEHYGWGDSQCNRWWEDLPAGKKKAYENVVRECQRRNITFCFSMNPNIFNSRVVNDDSPGSVDLLFKHYAWMQGLGVKWFNISLDDIAKGVNASSQARVVNEILRRLRAKDPEAQMIFCPTYYWGDGTGKQQKPYLQTLARELDKDVYMFWTGDDVVGRITRKGADTFRGLCGHRLFLWDNYPVNDDQPTMHLGPVIDRDPDLCEVVDGYMSNPMRKQDEMNRIPLATCADYSYNPYAYDPERSIAQAILHVGNTPAQCEALRDLVETYPGMLILGHHNTSFNSVQYQFDRLLKEPEARQVATGYLEHLQELSARLKKEFPGDYQPAQQTLDQDIQIAAKKLAATDSSNP